MTAPIDASSAKRHARPVAATTASPRTNAASAAATTVSSSGESGAPSTPPRTKPKRLHTGGKKTEGYKPSSPMHARRNQIAVTPANMDLFLRAATMVEQLIELGWEPDAGKIERLTQIVLRNDGDGRKGNWKGGKPEPQPGELLLNARKGNDDGDTD